MTSPRCLVIVVAVTIASCASPSPKDVAVSRDVPYQDTAVLDVYTREGSRDGPVVVLLHGCCGSKRDLSQFARGLAAEGAVVFNASWQNLRQGAAFPTGYQQAACAVRFARARSDRYGGDPARITLAGWSDGSLLGAVVASAGDDFREGCAVAPASSAVPDVFVGVGGFLGWPLGTHGSVDPRYVNDRSTSFFGGSPVEVPDAWRAGNPYAHLDRRPSLDISLVVGSDDPLLADNVSFAAAARAAGHRVEVSVVPQGGHLDLLAPGTAQGAAAVRQVLAAARRGRGG